jgi:hypothetical protein
VTRVTKNTSLGFEAERGAGADLHLVELERAGVEALDHEPEGRPSFSSSSVRRTST